MPISKVSEAGLSSGAQFNGFKNRIINGAMVIDQRNAGASVTPSSGGYTLDRWKYQATQSSKVTVQQSTTATNGFVNSLKATSASAYSVLSSDVFQLVQEIEGLNVTDLNFGSASASAVTLSFKVYSSLTGTFGGYLTNSAGNRSYVFSYSIPVANTWTTVSVTIAGDTTGTWLTTNGTGLVAAWSLGCGSTYATTAGSWNAGVYRGVTGQTNMVATNGATFYITGVQLEKGSTATSFDYRPYGTELALCQRYYESSNLSGDNFPFISFSCYTTVTLYGSWTYKVTKRATPTLSFNSASWLVYSNASGKTFSSIGQDGIGQNHTSVVIQGSGWSSGHSAFARNTDANAITASAEL